MPDRRVRRIALLICGALAKEVIALRDARAWDADVWAVPAKLHMHPRQIAPAVRRRFEELRDQYARVIVVYGDCGSGGALDTTLDALGIERVPGPHCYDVYAGTDAFSAMMDDEPGTFFLTDFLVRQFDALVIRELGLDRYPGLLGEYFKYYKRVVYLAQTHDETYLARARAAAEKLGLPLEVRYTGLGELEARLVALIEAGPADAD